MQPAELIPYAAFAACIATICGITVVSLRNLRGDTYLCDDCIYNNDEDCKKFERPKAVRCTTYRNAIHTGYEF